MDTLGLPLRAAFPMSVTQGSEGQHEGREPLLAVDDEPSLNAARADPAGCQHY